MIDRRRIKEEARGLIRTGYVSPIRATLIVVAICFVLDRVVSLATYGTLLPELYDVRYLQDLLRGLSMEEAMESAAAAVIVRDSLITDFFSFLVDLFTIVLLGGYYFYLMGIRKGWAMHYDDLLSGLSCAGRLIWCQIQIGLRVFAWSLLLLIPGLVAAYRYRFAVYDLMEDDTLSASQAIALSCRQTEGMKWDLFLLDLSFLGWSLLSSLTLNLLDIWLLPYKTLCDLGYREVACARAASDPPTWGPMP